MPLRPYLFALIVAQFQLFGSHQDTTAAETFFASPTG
jgi:hypothetical protein